MEFYLSYRGPLRATQRDPKPDGGQRTKHWQLKHSIRRHLHPQLKRVWDTTPFLIENQEPPANTKPYHIGRLAGEFRQAKWAFVPLVTGRLQLITKIDILLRRVDGPRASVWSGDLDNRIKTVIDALSLPSSSCGYEELDPTDGEVPLFCLLEDDKFLNSVSVEAAQLLDAENSDDESLADILIKVSIRPDNVTFANIGF